MESYRYLLDVAIILLATKACGLITRRFNLPQVVGALLAGLIFGPALLGFVGKSDFLTKVSELGVIVIMFDAGMTTNLKDLKNAGKNGFLVALIGVIVPLVLGIGVGYLFNGGTDTSTLYQNIFIGVILTATSVSITVETLKELGKFSTKVGNTILAAAIIDDVLGLICLTAITSLSGDNVNIAIVLLKIVLFFVFAIGVGILAKKFLDWYSKKLKNANLQRFPVFAFILCLLFSFCSEHFFGVADITGAFAAGLVIGSTSEATYIENRFRPLSYLLLTPVFFANIGLSISFPDMSLTLLWITLAIIGAAVVSKLIGCGIGARLCGMNSKEAIQVGVGMVCRGEVALIVANRGASMGLMNDMFMGPIILMVIITAIVTPVFLKFAFKKDDKYAGIEESALAEHLEMPQQLEAIERQVIEAERNIRNKGIK